MSLKYKIALIVVAMFLLSGSLDYTIQNFVVLPSYVALEREEAGKNMQRVIEAINRELQLINPSVADWAYWDDTYRFAAERNADYIAVNLVNGALENLKANLLNIYNLDGELLFGRAVQQDFQEPADLGELSAARLPVNHPVLRHPEITSEVVGIIATSQAPLLVVAMPVLTSHRQGPARGILMIGRFLDEAALLRVAEQTGLQLTAFPAATEALKADWLRADRFTVPHTPIRLEATNDTIQAHITLADLFGQPLLALRVDTPRTITLQGERVVYLALLSIAGTALLVMSVLLTMLHLTVLNPVGKLTTRAIWVGTTGDLRTRIALDRNDELGTLAREFDRMTERLTEARCRLIDQSYRDGIAEMARGVLHNIGNAITPITVRLETLKEDLHAVPAAEIGMALSELADAATSSERRSDLARFMELAGGELVDLAAHGQEQVTAITNQIGYIRQILADQNRYSQADRVLESVDMAEVVRDAAQKLAPAMQEAMAVVVDPSVNAVGTVTASRAALQQIVSNLLVNAAESIIASGVSAGKIVVGASRERLEYRPVAHLRFEDNGGGISPEHLEHIFEPGFSTKGRWTGLGLHWSANTANALGGRLYADSGEPGTGALLHLLLPLAMRAESEIDPIGVCL
ncbi:MAG: two-component system, NtrC family, sensor kinase [Pseudomonadota bacterium]|nr:two-component system, NtrC family, sensor kinase [Pseudomonadota bacterium]